MLLVLVFLAATLFLAMSAALTELFVPIMIVDSVFGLFVWCYRRFSAGSVPVS
jgi:hypothetical protein